MYVGFEVMRIAVYQDITGSAVSLSLLIETDTTEEFALVQIIVLRLPRMVGTHLFFYATPVNNTFFSESYFAVGSSKGLI